MKAKLVDTSAGLAFFISGLKTSFQFFLFPLSQNEAAASRISQ
jgi:hypothetical protein